MHKEDTNREKLPKGSERLSMFKKLSRDVYSYLGCEFTRQGEVYSRYGKKVTKIVTDNGATYVIIKPEKLKRKRLNLGRLIYEMFSGEVLGEDETIQFKDGDPTNTAYDNLQIVKKPKPKGKAPEKKFTDEQVQAIRDEYLNGERSQNQFDKTDKVVSMRSLMEKYNCSIGTIERIVHGKY